MAKAAEAIQPPPMPRPETFQKQLQILREIGASQRTIEIAEKAAESATGNKKK